MNSLPGILRGCRYSYHFRDHGVRWLEWATVCCLALLLFACGKPEGEVNGRGLVAGTVDVDPDLAQQLTGKERVFVVAESLEGERVAVQNLQGLDFPLNFCLTSANLIDVTAALPERMRLLALVTLSDSPFGSGMVGKVSQPVSLGSQNVRIEVSALSKEDFQESSSGSPTARAEGGAPVQSSTRSRYESGEEQYLQGTVSLGLSPDGGVKPSDVLYIIARSLDGRPAAVSAPYRDPRFPLIYRLSRENSMMGSISSDQDVVVIARLDRDGNAFSSPGDIEGESKRKPVRLGDRDVDIVLDRVVQ